MKNLTIKLVIPLSFISFIVYTKWWYALPIDAPDTMFYGFPFPYWAPGWGSSMTYQIFLLEFILDLFIYFIFWFVLIFFINRFVSQIKIPFSLSVFNFTLIGAFVFCAFLSLFNKDNHFRFNREYDIEIMDSGSKFIWQHIDRPDYYKYHPKQNELN